MKPSFTKHVDRRTLPAWVTRWICDTPVYEDGDGLAFGAMLEAGKIGCLNWMSKVDEQACQEVLREAKARRATGLYLPGKGHVPEFPIGDNDAIIEIPVNQRDYNVGYKIRCVIFDVYIKDLCEYKTDISFTPACSEAYGEWNEFCFGSGGYSEGEVDIESWMHVSESARGMNLTLSHPLLMFGVYGDDDSYHSFRMHIRPCDIDPCIDEYEMDQMNEDEILRVSIADVNWNKKFLRVEEFDSPCITIHDEEETEDEHGDPYTWRGFFDVKMEIKLIVIRGIYLPRTFQPEFWPGENEASYRSLYNSFSEVIAAGVIQRAWRRVACNPNHKIGNRILRKEAERFSV